MQEVRTKLIKKKCNYWNLSAAKWNPKDVSVVDKFRAIMVAIEIAMLEPKTQVAGVHVIINMEGFSLNHVYQFSPNVAKLMVDWVQVSKNWNILKLSVK